MTQNDKTGIIYLVGLGPGDAGYLNPNAAAALRDCDVVVGFRGYNGFFVHDQEAIVSGRGGASDRANPGIDARARRRAARQPR